MNLAEGLEQAWTSLIVFVPRLLLAAGILVVGFLLARLARRLVNRFLGRVGFDQLVARGGVKRALASARCDAGDLLSQVVFYGILLFVFQLAFGVFGPNPVSSMLTSIIGFLPNLFAAILIIVIASAIGAVARDLLRAALAGLAYGRLLAGAAAGLIVATGVFAALNQIGIAPAIFNGLFYAFLAVVAGSAIVAIGGGGILPMRAVWTRTLARLEQDGRKLKRDPEVPRPDERSETWKEEAETSTSAKPEVRSFSQ